MSLSTTLCNSCGQPVELSNAPHRRCANSHTHKGHLKKLSSTTKVVEGASRPLDALPDDGSRLNMNELQKPQGRHQGGPWWTAVDEFIDRQEESQLFNEKEEPSRPSEQLPLFPLGTTPKNT